jgi:alpha-aminoadipate carrier protein LysW
VYASQPSAHPTSTPDPSDALEGEIVTCPECGASFELAKSSEGFDLKPAQTVGEDWGQ